MSFPRRRLADAGATELELRRMERAFEKSSPGAQQTYLDHVARVAVYDLAEELAAARAPEPEPETLLGVVEPPPADPAPKRPRRPRKPVHGQPD